ncbi:MAG: 1-acyl-sn-glycerol-3-phosphate acyltransferase [Myxococcota bacterium]
MRPEDQKRILSDLRQRVVEEHLQVDRHDEGGGAGRSLAETLADSVYFETLRLNSEKPSRSKRKEEMFWREVREQLSHSDSFRHQQWLGHVVDRYATEICGNFDERVYQLATRAVVPTLSLLLNAVSPKRLIWAQGAPANIEDTVIVQGEVEHLRRLNEIGTVILAPTHISNLDSIILGHAIYRMGLPPFIYGAGLNLFSNPLISFFMNHLGAYTVDRKKVDPIYKQTLKTYASLTLEYGYNNLFFPGGTRSRSGALERHLKLGLLGTSVEAYVNALRRGSRRPRIFIVPATLSSQLVLEAETLIDDFLKDVGKARYIITDDEFSRSKRVLDFANQLVGLDSRIYVTVGRGFDPMGNSVDDEGESLDPRGRHVDPMRYTLVRGQPAILPQRDSEYTREVGERLKEAYMRDHVIQSTHVAAFAVLNLLRLKYRRLDLLRLLRTHSSEPELALLEVYREVERLLDVLRAENGRGKVRLSAGLLRTTADEVIQDALRIFACYHSRAAMQRIADRLTIHDRQLLFYYHNRLVDTR